MKNNAINAGSVSFESWQGDDGLYRCTFTTSWVPDSINVTLRKYRFKQSNIRTAWDNLVWHASQGKGPITPLEAFQIKCERYAPRMLDYDNLCGSFKDVIDAFVTARICAGDEWKRTRQWDVTQSKCKSTEQKIIVSITQSV